MCLCKSTGKITISPNTIAVSLTLQLARCCYLSTILYNVFVFNIFANSIFNKNANFSYRAASHTFYAESARGKSARHGAAAAQGNLERIAFFICNFYFLALVRIAKKIPVQNYSKIAFICARLFFFWFFVVCL